jgi:hypothetical protein
MEVGGVYESLKVAVEVQRLRMREQEVIRHEMAHKAVAGDLAGPVRYTYTRGPDGRLYITGGEVPLRIREGKTPEETVEIARRIKRAALAPARPSPQDIAVAVRATLMEMKALAEMRPGRSLDIRV